MRKFDETDEYNLKELENLNAEPWMVDLLKINPGYVWWGPYEDYMCRDDRGWESRSLIQSWPKFKGIFTQGLDDLNECVNFYFEIDRARKDCETCGGDGYHPDAQWISESFYQHSSPFSNISAHDMLMNDAVAAKFGLQSSGHDLRRSRVSEELRNKYGSAFAAFVADMEKSDGFWCDKITADEADFLTEHHRNYDFKHLSGQALADAFNEREKKKGLWSHDALNRGWLIQKRCERLAVPRTCPACSGNGYVFTAPSAHVNLVLWWLHPRKGCSKGIEVKYINQTELPDIFKFLREAAIRNAERFSIIPE